MWPIDWKTQGVEQLLNGILGEKEGNTEVGGQPKDSESTCWRELHTLLFITLVS